MAFLGAAFGDNGFDATQVEPSAPLEVIPPGKYAAQMVKSEMKDNSKGTGQNLEMEFEVIDGPHSGRKLWSSLSLVNPSQQAVEIAQRTLSAICHAVGKLQVSDSEELHFKPLLLSVKLIPEGTVEKSGYVHKRDKNEVEGFSPLDAQGARPAPAAQPQRAAAPPPRQAAPAQSAPPPRAAGGAPPWQRRSA